MPRPVLATILKSLLACAALHAPLAAHWSVGPGAPHGMHAPGSWQDDEELWAEERQACQSLIHKGRLREAVRPLLPDLPAGSRVVVRALPDAAGASVVELREQFASALAALRRRNA